MDKKILWETFRYIKKHSGFLAAALLFKTFLTAVKPFVLLHYSAAIVNSLYMKTDEFQIISQALLLSGWAMAMEMGEHILQSFTEVSLQKISYVQSGELAQKAMQMEYSLLESEKVQSLAANIKQFKFQKGDVFAQEVQFLESILAGIFGVLASLGYVMQFAGEKMASGADGWQFGAAFAGLMLLVCAAAFITVRNGKKRNENMFKSYAKMGKANRLYAFYRQNILKNYKYGKEIRIFDEKELIQDEFSGILESMAEFQQKTGKENSRFRLVDGILNTVLSAAAYVYIGINAYHQVISIGSVVKYSGAVSGLFGGIMQIIHAVGDLRGNEKFLGQYYEFLNLDEGAEPDEAVQTPDGCFEICFENVFFKYHNADTWALENVSFRISDKEHVAMVGANGSGKTTCIRLLLRLYTPNSGRILLNGKDIRKFDNKEYWRLMSVVFQDFKIFSIGLGQNIAGTDQAEEQKLMSVLNSMGMDETVGRMYAGTKSCLYKDYEERGVLISGGEAQKLAIAKALYKDAPVFVMDEPSAALDPVSEAELYEKTNILLKEKTMIFISHRLSSCCFCDKIFVLKDGRIAETGSHEELLARNGEYRKLWDAQARHYRG